MTGTTKLAGIALLAVVFAAGCGRPVDVSYRVTGTGTSMASMVTYQASDGSQQQAAGVTLPRTFTASISSGGFFYVSAQNAGESGCIKVEVVVKNQTVKQAQSCGGYVIAQASGTL